LSAQRFAVRARDYWTQGVAHALDYGRFHASAKVGHHGLGATYIA